MRISDWSSDVCSSDLVAQCCRHLCVRPLAMLEAQARTISCCSRGSKFRCCRSSCEPCEIAIPSSERLQRRRDRKSVGLGRGVSVRVDRGGRRNIKKKNQYV